MLKFLDKSSPALPQDVTMTWNPKDDFRVDPLGVKKDPRAAVESLCQIFRPFIKMGRNKSFGDMLLQNTAGELVPITAVMNASTFDECVYVS